MSGGRGIRTPGPREGSTVFKTAAIDRSAIPPRAKIKDYFIVNQCKRISAHFSAQRSPSIAAETIPPA